MERTGHTADSRAGDWGEQGSGTCGGGGQGRALVMGQVVERMCPVPCSLAAAEDTGLNWGDQ